MLVILRKIKFALLLGVSCFATSAADAQQAAPRKAPVPRTTSVARSSELQAYRQAATPEIEEQPAPIRATRMSKAARPAETPIFENEDFQPPVRTVANHARQNEAIAPVAAGCADGSCTSGTCDTGCASGNCISDCLPCNYYNQNGWYLGAEYLYTRVNYSDPAAVMTRTTVVDANNNSTVTDRVVPYDLDYQSTYRIYGGFRWGDCGESINFNFFNFNNGSTYVAPDIVQGGVIVAGHVETNPGPGERLISSLDTGVNTYDLDYSKRIPICSCNNNPCDCCDCPPWRLHGELVFAWVMWLSMVAIRSLKMVSLRVMQHQKSPSVVLVQKSSSKVVATLVKTIAGRCMAKAPGQSWSVNTMSN